jgi:Rrf2 family protein
MRLSRVAAYALQAVVYLAKQEDGAAPVTSHVIAEKRKVPERYLLKVLKPLVSAQVLVSVRGPNDGYRLARPAAGHDLCSFFQGLAAGG